jgi:hypothetical protein
VAALSDRFSPISPNFEGDGDENDESENLIFRQFRHFPYTAQHAANSAISEVQILKNGGVLSPHFRVGKDTWFLPPGGERGSKYARFLPFVTGTKSHPFSATFSLSYCGEGVYRCK